MWQFILGSAGFLLYFIYDINSIKKKKYIFPKNFSHGGRFWWFYRSSWSSGSRGGSASTESEE